MFEEYIVPFLFLLEEMAPYLLLGLLVAGILHSFVPRSVYNKWLSGNDLKSILLSVAFGIPLPLCSCGVVPTAVAMHKEGASRGATTAFLISTPQTGVDSIMATYSVFGLPFAILRPVASLVTGVLGGLAAGKFGGADSHEGSVSSKSTAAAAKKSFLHRCREALSYGFTDMLQDIGKWLVLGLVAAGLITIFVPDDFFLTFAGGAKWLNYLLVLLIAAPMYVCATGSIPIAAALMMKGLSPGAAFIFLMAGPATNLASVLVLGKTLGRKTLLTYLLSIFAGALAFGAAADYLLPQEWFTARIMDTMCPHCHGSAQGTEWWKVASAAVLLFLIARAFILKHKTNKTDKKMMTFKVTGMMCNHCKANVERAISALDGVASVEVDLGAGEARVEGTVDPAAVVKAVVAIGYGCDIA
ncbi:MAG: permease [Bacteroidales bacterium]|nr:permease [Bacteroidales bacterium]